MNKPETNPNRPYPNPNDPKEAYTTYRTSIAISPRIAEQLLALCKHHGESQSQTVRRLIIEAYIHLQDKKLGGNK